MGVRFFFVRGFEGFFEVLVALVAFLGVLALVVFETLAILTFLVVSEPSGEPDLDVLLLINLFLGSTWVGLR